MTRSIERNRERLTSGARIMRGTRQPALSYYVIARYEANGLELLQVPLGSGEETLPVFSSEVVAHDFLLSRALKQDWYVRESYAGELVSLLLGLCAGVEWVRIDPLPGEQAAQANPAEITHWETFVGYLLGSKDCLFPTPQQNLVLAAATPERDNPFLDSWGARACLPDSVSSDKVAPDHLRRSALLISLEASRRTQPRTSTQLSVLRTGASLRR